MRVLKGSNPIYSVLFVDGNPERQAVFEKAFREDYHIFLAGSGKQALEFMEKQTFQLVIAELSLPDMSGLLFLEQAMTISPDCSRVIMAAEGHMDEIAQAASHGILFQFVTRPWKHDELKIIIDGALELYFLKRQNRSLEDYLVEIREGLEMKVMERTGEIEQQRQKITDSIHYASRIQSALMLTRDELDRMLPPYFLLYKPKDIVSGDFYWVSRKGERLIIAVVDCTGHGVAGAFMSILGISLLNEIVAQLDEPCASDILDALRGQLISALGQTGRMDEAREGMEMALCIVEEERGVLQFAGAFNPLYIVREGELMQYRGDRMPIGIYHEEQLPFTCQEISFREGDMLYLFTDGYSDQIGGLQRKTFRTQRVKRLIGEIWDKSLAEQQSILREEHEIWRAGQEQIDDITVLGIRLRGSRQSSGPGRS